MISMHISPLYGVFVGNVARFSTYAFWGPNSGSSQLVRTPRKLCQPDYTYPPKTAKYVLCYLSSILPKRETRSKCVSWSVFTSFVSLQWSHAHSKALILTLAKAEFCDFHLYNVRNVNVFGNRNLPQSPAGVQWDRATDKTPFDSQVS